VGPGGPDPLGKILGPLSILSYLVSPTIIAKKYARAKCAICTPVRKMCVVLCYVQNVLCTLWRAMCKMCYVLYDFYVLDA